MCPNYVILVVDAGLIDEVHLNRLRAEDHARATTNSVKQRKGKKAVRHRQMTAQAQFCPGFDDLITISRQLLSAHVKSRITKTLAATEALRRYTNQWSFRSDSTF